MSKIEKLEHRLRALQDSFEQTQQEVETLEEREMELKKESIEKLKSGEPVSERNPFLMKKEKKILFLEGVKVAIRDIKKDLIKAKLDKLEKDLETKQKIANELYSEVEKAKKRFVDAENKYRAGIGGGEYFSYERENLENQLRELEDEERE